MKEVVTMRKRLRKSLAVFAAGVCVFSCAQLASAGELKLWEHENLKGIL